jgi:hypothetical protein
LRRFKRPTAHPSARIRGPRAQGKRAIVKRQQSRKIQRTRCPVHPPTTVMNGKSQIIYCVENTFPVRMKARTAAPAYRMASFVPDRRNRHMTTRSDTICIGAHRSATREDQGDLRLIEPYSKAPAILAPVSLPRAARIPA